MSQPKSIAEVEKLFDEKFSFAGCDGCESSRRNQEEIKQFWLEHFRSLLEEMRMEEKTRHLKKLSEILNSHSKPESEGGLDYKRAFEELESYENLLAHSLTVKGHSIDVNGNCNLGCC